MKLVEEHPDEDDIEPPPEQAAVDAIFDEIDAVTADDRWPRYLHWGNV